MAAPEVAAAVALLWEAKLKLRGQVAATATYLAQNTTKLSSKQSCGSYPGPGVPNRVYGYGLLNILRAVQAP